MIQCRKKWK